MVTVKSTEPSAAFSSVGAGVSAVCCSDFVSSAAFSAAAVVTGVVPDSFPPEHAVTDIAASTAANIRELTLFFISNTSF